MSLSADMLKKVKKAIDLMRSKITKISHSSENGKQVIHFTFKEKDYFAEVDDILERRAHTLGLCQEDDKRVAIEAILDRKSKLVKPVGVVNVSLVAALNGLYQSVDSYIENPVEKEKTVLTESLRSAATVLSSANKAVDREISVT